jgi:AcrR family transcriptional regulator
VSSIVTSPERATAKRPPPGRRAVQAEQTRRDILAAARRRFAREGYAATNLKDIAADAGVSVQTVYDSVGKKPDLVRRLNDLIDDEAQVGEIAATLATLVDPHAIARVPARITRRLVDRCGDILRACLAGTATEPGLAGLAEEGGRRHRAGTTAVAQQLADVGALRAALDLDQAATTIATLSDFRVAILLIDDHRMTLDQVEDWIAHTTIRAVIES